MLIDVLQNNYLKQTILKTIKSETKDERLSINSKKTRRKMYNFTLNNI